jgi:hypothetical protein
MEIQGKGRLIALAVRGQISASMGFTVYSTLLHSWLFLFSNVTMLLRGHCRRDHLRLQPKASEELMGLL